MEIDFREINKHLSISHHHLGQCRFSGRKKLKRETFIKQVKDCFRGNKKIGDFPMCRSHWGFCCDSERGLNFLFAFSWLPVKNMWPFPRPGQEGASPAFARRCLGWLVHTQCWHSLSIIVDLHKMAVEFLSQSSNLVISY